MSTRMSRYDNNENEKSSRIEKNKKLYEEIPDIDIDYIDINVDNIMEIKEEDLFKKARGNYQKRREIEDLIEKEKEEITEEISNKKDRIYDINEILKQAKEDAMKKKEQEEVQKKKRLISTEYNILTKLDMKDLEERDLKEDEIKEIVKNTYSEEEIENEIDNNEELFKDMIDGDDKEKEEDKENQEKVFDKEVHDIFDEAIDETIEDEEIDNEEKIMGTSSPDEVSNKEEIGEEKLNDNHDERTDTITTATQFLEKERRARKTLVFAVLIVIILLGVISCLLLEYFGTI